MRAYWILPNRDQRDEVRVSDAGVVRPLRDVVPPRLRPAGFSHGVPTELLEKCSERAFAEILFAQRFPRWRGDEELFCVSTTVGRDSSGRVVHLGLLLLLDPGERPTFDVPTAGLSKGDETCARAVLRRLKSVQRRDAWARSVRDLVDHSPCDEPIANVALERSVVEMESLYGLGRKGPNKKVPSHLKWLIGMILLLVLLAIVGGWLWVDARRGGVAVGDYESGEASWRFS